MECCGQQFFEFEFNLRDYFLCCNRAAVVVVVVAITTTAAVVVDVSLFSGSYTVFFSPIHTFSFYFALW